MSACTFFCSSIYIETALNSREESKEFAGLLFWRLSLCLSSSLRSRRQGGGRGGERVRKRRRETPTTKAASFAFRHLFQLSQLSLQRPIRIRRKLFCMTDFTRECIAKGGFVGAEQEKIFATECRRRDPHKNL